MPPDSPTPPAESAEPADDRHTRLVGWLLREVELQRAYRRQSAYAGWPQRRDADARMTRWPLNRIDPERVLVRRFTDPTAYWRTAPGPAADADRPRGADYTPAAVRAAARAVLVALVLEDA